MSEWIDRTSYSCGERGKTEPRIWELQAGPLRIVVHRYFGLDGWFLTCHETSITNRELPDDINEAKKVAVQMVKRWLKTALKAIETRKDQPE